MSVAGTSRALERTWLGWLSGDPCSSSSCSTSSSSMGERSFCGTSFSDGGELSSEEREEMLLLRSWADSECGSSREEETGACSAPVSSTEGIELPLTAWKSDGEALLEEKGMVLEREMGELLLEMERGALGRDFLGAGRSEGEAGLVTPGSSRPGW